MIQLHQFLVYVLKYLDTDNNIISEVILNKEEGSVPPNVSNALRDLVRRSKKELKAAEAAQSK